MMLLGASSQTISAGRGMATEESWRDILTELQAGNSETARSAVERYGRRLVAVARGQLGAELRPKVDPEDVVQSVFRSFFCRVQKGRFAQKSRPIFGLCL